MAAKGKSIWPPPVYVATFSDGTVCRMSIWSRTGKPLDFERGRKVCCSAIGAERVWKTLVRREWDWSPDRLPAMPPATDLVAGHFDQDGVTTPDPFFGPVVLPVRKPAAATLHKLIATLDKLSHDELCALSVEIDARLMDKAA